MNLHPGCGAQWRWRAPGAEGRPQPPVVCCRHLPVRDHLVYQLHRLACHLLWLQLRVGSGSGPWGPKISPKAPPPPPWLFITRVGWGGPGWPLNLRPCHHARVPAGHLHSGRQLCRASCTTCESRSRALGGDSNRGRLASDSRSAVVIEITGTSKSPLPKPNAGFIRDRWVSIWGQPLGGGAWPMLILGGL